MLVDHQHMFTWKLLLIISVTHAFGDNDNCSLDEDLKPDADDFNAYWACVPPGKLQKFKCPIVQNNQQFFDPKERRCLTENRGGVRDKRQLPSSAGSSQVGGGCSFNTDCVDGAFCENGVCSCWSTHVQINSFCWRKINPSQSGCQYDQQCNSVWPGAYCSSRSICTCPFSRPPGITRDGPVCYLPGECPTNGQNPRLKDGGSNTVSTCTFLSTPPVPGVFVGCDLWPDVYDCYNSQYCCPIRALSCIQPFDEGDTSPGTSTSQRWYYNSVARTCQVFTFLGSNGNGNNFETLEQCESYCKQSCDRGAPEFVSLTTTNNQQDAIRRCSTINTQSTSVVCGPNHQCDRIGSSLYYCCPKVSYVCGPYGGVQPANPAFVPNTPFTTGTQAIPGPSPEVRWYYDQGQGRCSTFQYLGQGGNFNNFLSQSDCSSYCSQSLCEQGQPLTDGTGLNNLRCGGGTGCPTTHSCTNNVCCPTTTTVCNQPTSSGANCNNPSTRYAYNAAAGVCQEFTYNGCQGNANKFETFLDCQNFCSQIADEPQCLQGKALKNSNNVFYQCSASSTFGFNVAQTAVIQTCPQGYECYFDGRTYGCCPTKTFTCAQFFDTGSACNPASSTRWFFDTTQNRCRTFSYNGCDGNSNNFATQRDCDDYCGVSGCPDGGTPLPDGTNQPQQCSTTSTCPAGYDCAVVSISNNNLIFGNVNANAASFCCPNKRTICQFIRDEGQNCGSLLTRWFYNPSSRTCESFTYFGCGGNANNFPTQSRCLNFCNSAACGVGERVQLLSGLNQVQTCFPGTISNQCSSGYSCTFDSLNNQNVCCGASDLGVCPSGQKAFVDGQTSSARQCTPNLAGSCPGNFLCVYNQQRDLYFCCGTTVSRFCPNNAAEYIDPSTNQVRACTGGGCPAGFTCQMTAATGNSYGYCCSGSAISTNVCGARSPYLLNGQASQCALGVLSQCPTGYSCFPSSNLNGISYCCSVTVSSNVCGSTGTAYNVNGVPSTCNPNTQFGVVNAFSTCPNTYTCRASATGDGNYYCCSVSAYAAYCGESTPNLVGNIPQQCYPGFSNTCPSNYVCELSAALNAYYCCTGGGCPSGYQALITNNQVRQCTPGITTCPAGYQCLFSATNQRSQCCTSSTAFTNVCTSGPAYIDPNTGTSRTCNVGVVNTCPSGYSCQGSVGGVGVCCQSQQIISSCPSGRTAYINSATGTGQICTLGDNSCPFGFICAFGTQNQYLCCSPAAAGCTNGGTAFIQASTGTAQTCTLPGQSQCARGYICVAGTNSINICCTNVNANPTCPTGFVPFVSSTTGQAQTCSGFNTCPAGYSCVQSVCCRNSASPTGLCPNNATPLSAFGNPVTCVPNFSTCQQGFTCQVTGTQSVGYCCPGQTIATGSCPSGQGPYINPGTGQPQTCAPNSFTTGCISGYACQQSTTGSFICCASGSTGGACPRGTPVTGTGSPLPLACPNAGFSGCPGGASCLLSPLYNQYVCCAGFGRAFRLSSDVPPPSNLTAVKPSNTTTTGTTIATIKSVASGDQKPNTKSRCAANQVPSKDGQCLKQLSLGVSGCTEDSQCIRGWLIGRCSKSTCKCSQDQVLYNGLCLPKCPASPIIYVNVDGVCKQSSVQYNMTSNLKSPKTSQEFLSQRIAVS